MSYLSGKTVIDDALSLIHNNSTPVRDKMLLWLNVTAQKLAIVRPWHFLSNGSASVVPVNNVLTMPADFGELQYLQAGNAFFLDPRNQLTPGEAYQLDKSSTGQAIPRGYTIATADVVVGLATVKRTVITLHGAGFSDAVTVAYSIEPPTIVYTTDDTSWPVQCRPLLMRALLDFFYEYDMDERAATSYQLSQSELSELKKWDNSKKPKTQRNRHGYRGTR